MKLRLLALLMLLGSGVSAQTTAWSSSPAVTPQTRTLSGAKQIRWIWGSSSLFSLPDTLALFGLKTDSSKYLRLNSSINQTATATLTQTSNNQPLTGWKFMPTFANGGFTQGVWRAAEFGGGVLFDKSVSVNGPFKTSNIQINIGSDTTSNYITFRDSAGVGKAAFFSNTGNWSFGDTTAHKEKVHITGKLGVTDSVFMYGIPSSGTAIGVLKINVNGNVFKDTVATAFVDKGYVDSLSAMYTLTKYYYTTTGSEGNNLTYSGLINMYIDGIWRDGSEYQAISSGTPLGNQVKVDLSTGKLTFSDNFIANEYLTVRYRGSPSPTPTVPTGLVIINVATYAAMNVQLSGTTYKIFFVQADEVNGGGAPSQYLWYNGALIRNVPQLAN